MRAGFTLMELTICAAIIAVLVVVVAQCIHLSLRERARVAAHQAASELAANILEEARARPIAKLDKAWADACSVPLVMAELLPGGKVAVTVEAEKTQPHTRRVTVEVSWRFEQHVPPQSTRLTTLFCEPQSRRHEKDWPRAGFR